MSNHVSQAKGETVFGIVSVIFLSLAVIIVLYPLLYIVSASFSDPLSIAKGEVVLFPRNIAIDAYSWILDYKNVLNSYKNTIIYTVVGTVVNLIMTMLCAYPLSRKELKSRNVITFIMSLSMIFGGGMIPTYLVVKSLNLIDTMWALVLPVAISTWNMLVMKNYFQTSIPVEMTEAAKIDGAGPMTIFLKIALPLSMPIIAVMIIFFGAGHWNAYFGAMIYLRDMDKYPLQLVLKNLLASVTLDGNSLQSNVGTSSLVKLKLMLESMKYAACVISTLPILVLYPLMQRYFASGVMLGAIKG